MFAPAFNTIISPKIISQSLLFNNFKQLGLNFNDINHGAESRPDSYTSTKKRNTCRLPIHNKADSSIFVATSSLGQEGQLIWAAKNITEISPPLVIFNFRLLR
jgi:hypothetical protein